MIIQVTQELIDRLQHTAETCSDGDGVDLADRKPHFPCLIEQAYREATGQRVSFTSDGKSSLNWERPILNEEGRRLMGLFDNHQPITPGSFEVTV